MERKLRIYIGNMYGRCSQIKRKWNMCAYRQQARRMRQSPSPKRCAHGGSSQGTPDENTGQMIFAVVEELIPESRRNEANIDL